MKELWNSDFFIDDNTLSVNVARLRKKLEEAGLEHFIETKKRDRIRVEQWVIESFFVKHYLLAHRRYLYLLGLLLSSLLLFAYIFEVYRHFLLYLTGILAFF